MNLLHAVFPLLVRHLSPAQRSVALPALSCTTHFCDVILYTEFLATTIADVLDVSLPPLPSPPHPSLPPGPPFSGIIISEPFKARSESGASNWIGCLPSFCPTVLWAGGTGSVDVGRQSNVSA